MGGGGAGVGNADRIEAAIGRVPHRVVDVLVGGKAGEHQRVQADIAQQILDTVRVEDAQAGAVAPLAVATQLPFTIDF